MNYLFHLLIYFEIYAIVALSLNLLIGYGGLLEPHLPDSTVFHPVYLFGSGAGCSGNHAASDEWGRHSHESGNPVRSSNSNH